MRILLIWNYYEDYITEFFARRSELTHASYRELQTALLEDFFSWPGYLVRALRALGHEAEIIVQNAASLQAAWARDHAIVLKEEDVAGEAICLQQIADFRPDVLLLWPGFLNQEAFLKSARKLAQKTFVWVASPLHARPPVDAIDCILTSFPHFVDMFRSMGARCEFFQAACFDPAIIDSLIGSMARDIPVSFVGGLNSSVFSRRLSILTEVASHIPLQLWGYDLDRHPPRRPWQMPSFVYWHWRSHVLRSRFHGAVYGLDFFSVLRRSRITLNVHINVAEGVASNMRLFEATGSGALLLTEESPQLSVYFSPGQEVVTFASAGELERKVKYYLLHEDERAEIALAGQKRTIRDHNSLLRAKQLIDIFAKFV